MSLVNTDPQCREQMLTMYRLCVSLAKQIRVQLSMNPARCPLCQKDHDIQPIVDRAFSKQ